MTFIFRWIYHIFVANSYFIIKNIMEVLSYWSEVIPHPLSALAHATLQYHHGVQFIAMVGKHLLPQKDDDSQTNMEWWPDKAAFAGRRIPADRSFRLVLETTNFQLALYEDARHKREALSLQGLSRDDVFHWIRDIIHRRGLDVDQLDYIRHYTLPDHPLLHGAPFEAPTQSAQEVLATYRNNAELIISHFAVRYRNSSPIRVWPHHFDTGSLISLEEEHSIQRFVGVGLNIPDDLVNDYYFYVNHHISGGQPDYTSLTPFQNIGTWQESNPRIATLALSEIAGISTSAGQVLAVKSFLVHAIEQSIAFIGQHQQRTS